MALNATAFLRPRLAPTTSVNYTPTVVLFEDAPNNRVIIDEYATINAASRLIEREIVTYTYVGKTRIATRETYRYTAALGSVYNPASLTTATTAPFTVALGVKNTGEATDLDAVHTSAGTAAS